MFSEAGLRQCKSTRKAQIHTHTGTATGFVVRGSWFVVAGRARNVAVHVRLLKAKADVSEVERDSAQQSREETRSRRKIVERPTDHVRECLEQATLRTIYGTPYDGEVTVDASHIARGAAQIGP